MILVWFTWWVVASLLGLLAFPVAYRIFNRLPDRGYAFARPMGLLAASYTLWLGASLGLLRNSAGGTLAGVMILAGLGWIAGSGRWEEIRGWIRANRKSMLAVEGVFLVGFGLWAFVRSSNPEIQHTEKPMELAFLNAILRSSSFPPDDPWLSGHAISYYYFGYVMLALLTRLTGVAAGMAFNLGNALWFGLVAVGAYGLLFNLLAARGRRSPLASSLLGPAFVLLTGNLEGFLDVLHARHIFWRTLSDGTMHSGFWRWLDLKQLVDPPVGEPAWIPGRFLWWWRASRVVRDVNLAGVDLEVIDEFPFFSFLLADNHPHLLAIPFALLAVGLTLQLFLQPARGEIRMRADPPSRGDIRRAAQVVGAILMTIVFTRAISMLAQASSVEADEALSVAEILGRSAGDLLVGVLAAAVLGYLALFALGGVPSALARGEILFAAWLFGALAFLNTWDSPIYLSLLLVVLFWKAAHEPAWEVLKRVTATGVTLGLAAILLYLPWYPTFSSQAAGVLPNLIFPTRLPQFVVMFGVSFIPILAWLIWRAASGWRPKQGLTLARLGLGIPLGLLALSLALAASIYLALFSDPLRVGSMLSDLGVLDMPLQERMGILISAVASRRLEHPWTALVLGFTIALGYLLLRRRNIERSEASRSGAEETWPFVVLMIGIGALLVLGPEYFYLRDLFGTRMNTVFKFYFAAWILWGLAGSYAIVELWPTPKGGSETVRALLIVPLLLGFVYPLFATWTKTSGFSPPAGRTLDGTAYLDDLSPADARAIDWINQRLDSGVIAEAVGGSYTQYGRVSAHTGLPTVLGWDFHELQWRGSMAPQGARNTDIRLLYETADWSAAASVLDRYHIAYVYVGPLEAASFQPLNLRKFDQHMDRIYDNGEVRIYATRQEFLR